MSVRAKPTIIGIFVCGAAVLAVAAVLMFGGGKVFNHQEKFIIYFADSVNGLQVGSAVKYKGVQIGQVSNIYIHYDQGDVGSDDIPVLIEIDTTRLHRDLGDDIDLADPQVFEEQIKAGLRARLQMQSFVTFQLYIELDYVGSGNPPKPISLSHLYKEIPSIPAGLSEVVQSITTSLENLSKVDFADLANKVNHLADELTTGVDQINFKEINDNLVLAGKNVNALLADPKIKEALDKLGSTLDDLDHLANSVNQQVQPLTKEIQSTAESARATLDQINQTLASVRDLVAPDSSLHTELDRTLQEITNASRAIRILADFLEANPSTLIFGKSPPAGLPAPVKSAKPAQPAPAASIPAAPPATAPAADRPGGLNK